MWLNPFCPTRTALQNWHKGQMESQNKQRDSVKLLENMRKILCELIRRNVSVFSADYTLDSIQKIASEAKMVCDMSR